MENKKAFRLHLNLFDGIVILLALVVGGLLLWTQLKPAAPAAAPAAEKIQYTIVLKKTVPGTGERVKAGDALEDTIKNYSLGNVVSVEVVPAEEFAVDTENDRYVLAEVPDKEDVYITVESSAVISDAAVTVGSGYEIRVGEAIYVRGPGYLGSGTVYAIERGGEQ